MSTALAAARAKTKGKRLLRDALEAYGEDDYTLSEWNGIKKQAELDGKWRWKVSDTSATLAAVKERVDKDGAKKQLQDRFATDMDAVMNAELHAPPGKDATQKDHQDDDNETQCAWRERIGGKQYCCVNELPAEKAKHKGQHPQQSNATAKKPRVRRQCKWHARECVYSDHPVEKSRAIEIPNDQGFCLSCYETTALKDRGTLQKTPQRLPATKIPGVREVDLRRDVQRNALLSQHNKKKKTLKGGDDTNGLSRKLTAQSVCKWEKEHSESAFVWRCGNKVVMHPTLRGAFLPFCGYHVPRCIQEYGASGSGSGGGGKGGNGAACPPILDRRNAFGMCRNHVEAQLSTMPFEARAKCVFADSEFDVPGIIECRHDRLQHKPKRHVLAPKTPPPSLPMPSSSSRAGTAAPGVHFVDPNGDQLVAVKSPVPPTRFDRFYRQYAATQQAVRLSLEGALGPAVSTLLNHPNVVSSLLKEAWWQLQFLRRGAVVATRIQRIHRGNRARRRVRAILLEHSALQRLAACRKIQRIARGYIGRRVFAHAVEAMRVAVPTIQRVIRGALARKKCKRLRSVLLLQRNFRAYRQRCFAWAMKEEMAYMRDLQRQADANYDELQLHLLTFRRLRARRVLRAHVARWKHRKAEHARLAAERLLSLLSAIKIQRAFRRHQYYTRLKRRYVSAQRIQSRVRGWLTRHMWKDDPGILHITRFVSPLTGFVYGKTVVLAQPSCSYAFPSRVIRMKCGALAIQRLARGFLGRVAANMRWVAMLKRWEWLGMGTDIGSSWSSSSKSHDSMTLGHEWYGFLLPSHEYHREPRLHMMPVKKVMKPDKGFAYKYQSILELIEDRDGKRAWSLAREEKWKCDREDGQQRLHGKHGTTLFLPRRDEQPDQVAAKAIALAQAVYPIGSIVLVASTLRRATQRFRTASVQAVHSDPQQQNNASTFDVEYLKSFLSQRGVRVYREARVPLARLRPVGLTAEDDLSQRKPLPPVGSIIQKAIDRLKTEIRASQAQRQQHPTGKAEDKEEREGRQKNQEQLRTVDALADRFRVEDPFRDLLLDHRDFVNFVFQNSQMLRIKWLQVIDHVRYGTRDKPLDPSQDKNDQRTPSGLPLTPSLQSFYREFGFQVAVTRTIMPMPERAQEIETRMVPLGFLHDPSANVRDEDEAVDDRSKSQRPHTTPVDGGSSAVKDAASCYGKRTMDDTAEDPRGPLAVSPQDLQRQLYELKTLPRERHREKILEVPTRHARSFVCGFPACGQCFSSHEAARLHQEGVHLHQRRLATATPLVDQYLHAYWPPQSPWNQELHRDFVPSVGYFHCSHANCTTSELQFRTRRELQRHARQCHQSENRSDGRDGDAIRTTSPRKQLTAKQSSTSSGSTGPPLLEGENEVLSSAIWLGTFAVCRSNLPERLAGFPSTASWHGSDPIQCGDHPLTQPEPEECRACFLHRRRLALPCRLYRSVALPGCCRPQHLDEREEDGNKNESECENGSAHMEGYVIFSTEDASLCAVVRDHDVVALDEDEKDRKKRLGRLQRMTQQIIPKATANSSSHIAATAAAVTSSLVFLRIETLCRDANNLNWAIGHAFLPAPSPQTKEEPVVVTTTTLDSYEVTLDEAHVVAVALDDICASCVVHQCASTHEFASKNPQRDDPAQLRQLSEQPPPHRTSSSSLINGSSNSSHSNAKQSQTKESLCRSRWNDFGV